jgi:hypothetical protein
MATVCCRVRTNFLFKSTLVWSAVLFCTIVQGLHDCKFVYNTRSLLVKRISVAISFCVETDDCVTPFAENVFRDGFELIKKR